MPTSADYKTDSGKSILLIGDSGTHKTWLMGQAPKIQIFDFDRGLRILRGGTFSYDTFKDAPYAANAKAAKMVSEEHGIYPWGTAWPAFVKRVNEVGEAADAGKSPFESLGFDSLTTMSNIAMNYVLKENNRSPSDGPRIQDWGAQIQLLEMVVDQVNAWPFFYKIFTAHVQRDTNMLTQSVEKLPLVTGKFAAKVSIYFDEVYFTDVRKKKDAKTGVESPEFFLRTTTDPSHRQAKSRHGVPDGTAAEWPQLLPYYNK